MFGHVLRKEDTEWVKKCRPMEYEVEGSRPRQRGHGHMERGYAKKIAKHVI